MRAGEPSTQHVLCRKFRISTCWQESPNKSSAGVLPNSFGIPSVKATVRDAFNCSFEVGAFRGWGLGVYDLGLACFGAKTLSEPFVQHVPFWPVLAAQREMKHL